MNLFKLFRSGNTSVRIRRGSLELWLCAGTLFLSHAAAAAIPPAGLQAAVSQSLRQMEPVGRGKYAAQNPEQRLVLDFDGQGLEVAPGGKAPGWRWRLSLSGYGVPGRVKPVGKAEVVTAKQRVEYRRGALTEWYENRAEGLEQGFTLLQPPLAGAEAVEIRLESRGLKAEIEAGGRSAKLSGKDGRAVLAYRDLSVVDANGKPLPARLAQAGGQLAIDVDVRGAVWPVVVDPLIGTEQAKLSASDAGQDDLFGYSVAVEGDTAVVGAPAVALNAGAVYVYVRNAGAWTQEAKLTAADGTTNAALGRSVAIAGDTVIAGASSALVSSYVAGAAYVFVKPAAGWVDGTQTAKLTASDRADYDQLGYSVAISGDVAIAGANGADVAGKSNAGAAYVFVKPGGGWADGTQAAKLTASDGSTNHFFGTSVSISGDNALVGSPRSLSASAGSAYVFVKPAGGWADATQTARLTASDTAPQQNLGSSVSIAGDTAVAGASGASIGVNTAAGAAYVFVKPAGGWKDGTQIAKLTASDAASDDALGYSVSIAGDTVIAGAPNADVSGLKDAGAAYVYVKPGSGWSDGTQSAKVAASDASANDYLGLGVGVSGDTAVVGAMYADTPGHLDSGAAYVYTLKYDLRLTVSAGGAVSGSLGGFDLTGPDTVSTAVAKDASVTLTAAPNAGYSFAGWSGACSGSSLTCTVVMGADQAVSVTFASAPTPVPTVTPTPTVKPTPKPVYQLSVAVSGSDGATGTVTSTPHGINCGSVCTALFPVGTKVYLTARLQAGSVFEGWSHCDQVLADQTCVIKMGSSHLPQVVAQFRAAAQPSPTTAPEPTPLPTAVPSPTPAPAPASNQVTLSVVTVGEGRVTSLVGGIDCGSVCSAGFDLGSAVTLTATPAEGYKFKRWTGAGCSGSKPCSVTVNRAKTVKAKFVKRRKS